MLLGNLLLFSIKVDGDSIILGDVKVDIFKQGYETEQYIELLQTFIFQVQNSEPNRVTTSSATCNDHILARKHI